MEEIHDTRLLSNLFKTVMSNEPNYIELKQTTTKTTTKCLFLYWLISTSTANTNNNVSSSAHF